MESILENLFFGNVDVNTTFPNTQQYRKAMETICGNETALNEMLDGRAKSLFHGFATAHAEMNGITAVDKFITGFHLGALVMTEVFYGKDRLTTA